MIKPATVYVKLIDEGVDVWRPVAAEQLSADEYRLVDAPLEGEAWPFAKNDVVRCERRQLSGQGSDFEDVLVGCEKSR